MNSVWKAPATPSARTQAAGGHDLTGSVAVGGNQVELLEAGQHLGFVTAENGGHAGRLVGAGLGHLRAAGGGQSNGVVWGDHTGDRVGGDLTDRVAGHNSVFACGQASLGELLVSKQRGRNDT